MTWTTPGDLRLQLSRRWERGDLLRPLVTDEEVFPLRMSLKGPTSAQLTERFDAVRAWAAELAAMPHVRLEWRQVRHRVHGLQRLPCQAWIDTLDDALTLLRKQRDAERLARIVELSRQTVPAVIPWLARRPLLALELESQWAGIMAVVRWTVGHPRPGIYLRQVDVSGVHSKFIEAHRAVLAELLDLALPPEAVDASRAGIGQFAARYGFADRPARIRFRALDPSIRLLPGAELADLTVDADSFALLDIAPTNVFITENETNFLAFPAADGAIVIFGAGYGWEALARAEWLMRCRIHYWGDIDTHGFGILSQLRSRFGHVSSFLMDRHTLDAHKAHWGEEPEQVCHDLSDLTAAEHELFDELRGNRIRMNLRLEQERIGFGWVSAAVQRILAESPPHGQPATDPNRS